MNDMIIPITSPCLSCCSDGEDGSCDVLPWLVELCSPLRHGNKLVGRDEATELLNVYGIKFNKEE